jgi:hypothetical protein
MTPTEGSVLSEYYQNQQRGRRSPDTQGLVNDIRIGPDRRNAGYDFLGNLVYLDTGERVKPQDMPEDLSPSNVYPNQYNGSDNSVIPEDLSQPMVGPNSAYGPYYEFGPNGPYDTRNINDPRHPDNPNNRQVPEVEPDNYQRETGLQDPTEIRTVSKEQQAAYEQFMAELDARSRAAEAEAAAGERTAAAEAELAAGDGGYPNPMASSIIGDDRGTPYPTFDPSLNPQIGTTEPQKPIYPPAPTQSAGYLRSTGEGGYGAQAYYDEINAYLAGHSPEEIQQAMGTYGVSQEDVDAAKAYQAPQAPQPQYARGGLSRMLRKVR